MHEPPAEPTNLPAVGSVWTERPRRDPLTPTGDGLVVVTEASMGVWGPRCTVVPIGDGGSLSGPVEDVLRRRACIGVVAHAFTEAELRDPDGPAARQVRDGALTLARAWFEAGKDPRPDGAG